MNRTAAGKRFALLSLIAPAAAALAVGLADTASAETAESDPTVAASLETLKHMLQADPYGRDARAARNAEMTASSGETLQRAASMREEADSRFAAAAVQSWSTAAAGINTSSAIASVRATASQTDSRSVADPEPSSVAKPSGLSRSVQAAAEGSER